MIEMVARPHAVNFVKWARNRPEVVVLSGDLTKSCEVGDFKQAYPDRFFSLGVAEQNMMGFAAGLAREGFSPWVHTFGVFICRRPYDQIAMSIAYPNLPVRLVGFLPGITTPGGVTHQAIDDVALMRQLPNMTVLQTGDATDVESVLDVAESIDGPVYIRMVRGQVPRLFPSSAPLELGHARVLSEGDEVTLLTSGICTQEALRLTELLQTREVSIQHLHVSTLKPFNDPLITEAVDKARFGVITLENHSIIGGLGSAVAEMMAESGVGRRLVRMGLKDTFAHGAGQAYLMSEYELDAVALMRTLEELMSTSFDIDPNELTGSARTTSAKAVIPEAL